MAPAIGKSSCERPGRNLATTSDLRPQRAKVRSVSRMRDSGARSSRAIRRSTRAPNQRPIANQARSAMTIAVNAVSAIAEPDSTCREARLPATIRVGSAGIGTPIC